VKAGNYAQAIATYQQAANLDRQNPKIFSGIGYLEARQGHFQEAAKAYQQAIAVVEKARDLYRKKGESEGEKKAESMLQELKKLIANFNPVETERSHLLRTLTGKQLVVRHR
jgi:tetratricopeptide (TPR) repeat protein